MAAKWALRGDGGGNAGGRKEGRKEGSCTGKRTERADAAAEKDKERRAAHATEFDIHKKEGDFFGKGRL